MEQQAGATLATQPTTWAGVGTRLLKSSLTFARRKPLGAVAGFFLFAIVVVALFATVIAPYSATEFGIGSRLASPGSEHLFGTDNLGRDVFSRVLVGSRIALIVGFGSVILGTTLGSIIGMLSGYIGGKADITVQRFIDTLIALPSLVFALTLVAVLGQSLFNVIFAVALALMPGPARIIRAQTLSVKESQFIEAARAMGATGPRIVVRHILPQVVPLYIVLAASSLGVAVLIEASLSFLGLGPPPPAVSWGGMLSGSITQYVQKAPWMAVCPGLAITFTVLAVNLLGDTLRDVLDPRLRR